MLFIKKKILETNFLQRIQENYSWQKKPSYQKPVVPIDGCSTYNLSYWPTKQKPRKPFLMKNNENILSAGCCFEDHTTYNLSYWNGTGDHRPDPIIPKDNHESSDAALAKDTVNKVPYITFSQKTIIFRHAIICKKILVFSKLSYLGNWGAEPEKPIVPCSRQLLGRGPIQDCTTNKHDFTWKRTRRDEPTKPKGNLTFSDLPIECKLSAHLLRWTLF